ncbi:MAG: 16S rRNA (adenine(1518)-N(6)/adenine(1519)-N(6))-dimethyltransferase RsmA [Thermoanaerobaculia bacterium]
MVTGSKLRKSLGQHHLTRGEVCRPLIEFLRPAGSLVVEIGPGGGVLTRELLAAGARVLALELDLAWAFHLRGPALAGALRLVAADALAFPWERLPPGTLVTGNLPYNVGSAIVQAVVRHPRHVPRAGFLLQQEVVERLTAAPGERPRGALSALVQARAGVRTLGRVRPGAFRPPPKVESAFVGLEPHPPPLSEKEWEAFARLVHLGFGQRRKTLRNALASAVGRQRAEQWLADAGVDPSSRAERLDLEAWLALHRAAGADGIGW